MAQIVVRNQPVPMEFVALHDYAQSGKPELLLARYGLDSQGIQASVIKALKRKTK